MTDRKKNNPNESMQINAAVNQRVAGRDFFEDSSPRSIKLALATWPSERLDELALDNPRMFAHRFGFEASSTVRQQVIDIQKQHDLTDRQIRCLRLGGQIVPGTPGVKLAPSLLAPIAGLLLLAMLCIFCISMTPIVLYAHAASWRLLLGQIILGVMCLGTTWVVTTVFIQPWIILKRAGVLNSAHTH